MSYVPFSYPERSLRNELRPLFLSCAPFSYLSCAPFSYPFLIREVWDSAEDHWKDEVNAYGAEIPFYEAVLGYLRGVCCDYVEPEPILVK